MSFTRCLTTFLVLTCSVIGQFSLAQAGLSDSLLYEGPYRPDVEKEGIATFYYQDVEGSRIKNGDFSFVRKQLDTLCGNEVYYEEWRGKYSNDLKSGDWQYSVVDHSVSIADVVDTEPVYQINSTRSVLKGGYNNNLWVGNWTFQAEQASSAGKSETIFSATVPFDYGKVDGRVDATLKLHGKEASIKGNCENGLMTGTWRFSYFNQEGKEIDEIRIYNQGILLELHKLNQSDTVTTIQFPLSELLQGALNGNEESFDLFNQPLSLTFSDGYPRNSELIQEQQQANDLIRQVLRSIVGYDLENVTKNGAPMGTNRGFYKLNSEEKQWIEDWKIIQTDFLDHLNKIEERRLKSLNYLGDSTLIKIFAWHDKQKEINDYIKPWNDIILRNEIEFYNREGLLVNYAHKLLSRDSLSLYDAPWVVRYSPVQSNNFLKIITHYFKERNNYADSLNVLLESRLENIFYEQSVRSDIEELNKIQLEVDSLAKVSLSAAELDIVVGEAFKKYIEDSFSPNFSSLLSSEESAEIRKQRSDSLKLQLEEYRQSIKQLPKINANMNRADSLFTDYAFDPFTYNTRVPIKKKKIMFEAVIEDMYKTAVNAVKQNSSAENIQQYVNNYRTATERLLFYEDKDTRKLEKRLRKARTFEEKLELLNSYK